MVGHGGSSAGSHLTDPTSPIPSHCASIVMTSTVRVNLLMVAIHVMRVSAKSSVIIRRVIIVQGVIVNRVPLWSVVTLVYMSAFAARW